MHLLFWVSAQFWSCLALGVYTHTAKPGYSYRRMINISVLVCFVFWLLHLVCGASCDVYFFTPQPPRFLSLFPKSEKNETAAAYCELCTIKCQRCVADMATRPPQQTYSTAQQRAAALPRPNVQWCFHAWLVTWLKLRVCRWSTVVSEVYNSVWQCLSIYGCMVSAATTGPNWFTRAFWSCWIVNLMSCEGGRPAALCLRPPGSQNNSHW